MKIITDILCLILKVRTQLISSSWIYDQASHAVVHPAFQTIKASYLAFKDYSGFLYKGKPLHCPQGKIHYLHYHIKYIKGPFHDLRCYFYGIIQ